MFVDRSAIDVVIHLVVTGIPEVALRAWIPPENHAIGGDIDNIPVGVDFRAHVDAVLDKSDIVLVIVGSRWLGGRGTRNRLANPTDPVRIEVETALRKGTPVVPVLIGRTGMPKPEQLPESMVDFVYRNGVRVDTGQDFDLHIERLFRAIDVILGTTATRDDPPPFDARGGALIRKSASALEIVLRGKVRGQPSAPPSPSKPPRYMY